MPADRRCTAGVVPVQIVINWKSKGYRTRCDRPWVHSVSDPEYGPGLLCQQHFEAWQARQPKEVARGP